MQTAAIPVLILAGGRGTRLGSAAPGPKPLALVGGRPFIVYLLADLHAQGFRRVLFLTGYQAEELERGVRAAGRAPRSSFLGELTLEFLPEGQPLGTGGALAAAASQVRGEALLLNGDSSCEVDLAALLDLRRTADAPLCLTAVEVADAADYGRIVRDEGRVVGFEEKGAAGPGWINAGVYAFTDRFLSEALRPGPASLERDVLPAWVARRATPALEVRGLFRDIGTPERLAAAQREFPPARLAWLDAAGRP